MQLIERLIKLNVLYLNEMDRRGVIKLKVHGQYWDNMTNRTPNCTIAMAVKNVKNKIDRNSKNDYLKTEIKNLQEDVGNSDVKDLRFWNCKNKSEKEYELSNLALKRMLYMMEMVSIDDIVKILNSEKVTHAAVKQACQQNRLLNTRKRSKAWNVHIGECRAYWGVPDTNEKNLYKDWEY